MQKLFAKKNLTQILKEANNSNISEHGGAQLKRQLGPFHLVMIGVGAIIGAGIFSLTGTAAAYYAGPGIIYSFIIAGVLCTFAGLCYAEMAAMIPISGSAYTYSYATMGEFIAWIIGWDLILEYMFGAVIVAIAWSGYLCSLVTKTLGIPLNDTLIRFTKGPWEFVSLSDGTQATGFWNLPATLVIILLSAVLYRGIRESSFLNNLVVLIKVSIIIAFIGLGWTVINPDLWIADPTAAGLARLVPPPIPVMKNGHTDFTFGWPGILTGAGVVFIAYIGFDIVSTTAQECRNPSKDLPIGILASLFICTSLYVLMSLVITGVVPFQKLGVSDPIAVGIDQIVSLRGWSPEMQKFITFFVKFGAVAGLTSVILALLFGQTRIFYSMARDGLLPWFDKIHHTYATPHIATVVTCIFVSICAGVIPMSLVGELVSIGTLLAFTIVCIGILVLRRKHPNLNRPFKTPLYWLVSPLGAITCLWVMTGLPEDTWVRLIAWLLVGLVIYFGYGTKNSRLRIAARAK